MWVKFEQTKELIRIYIWRVISEIFKRGDKEHHQSEKVGCGGLACTVS